MKKYYNLISGLLLILFLVSSCERDVQEQILTLVNSPSGVGVDNTDPFVCTEANTKDVAYTFDWEAADFGPNISCTYVLQFDKKGGDFTSPFEITAGINVQEKSIISKEVNDIMYGLKLPIDNTICDVDVRVLAKPMVVGTATPNIPLAVSDKKITIQVASFIYRDPIHLIGTMFGCHPWMAGTHPTWVDQFAWDAANYRYLFFRDNPFDNIDVYTAQFRGDNENAADGSPWIGAFKIRMEGTTDQLGKTGEGTLGQGGDIKDIKAPGYYTIKVNISAKTYSIDPFDASGAVSYTSAKLTGSALQSDVTMVQAFNNPHIWTANDVVLTDSEVKFNLDGALWGSDKFPWGIASQNGEGVKIFEAGTYFVKYNDLTGHYVFYKR